MKHLERAVEIAPQFASGLEQSGNHRLPDAEVRPRRGVFPRGAGRRIPNVRAAGESRRRAGQSAQTRRSMGLQPACGPDASERRARQLAARNDVFRDRERRSWPRSTFGKRSRSIRPTSRIRSYSWPRSICAAETSSAAAADLESFLKYHPDWPQAAAMREKIAEWKKVTLRRADPAGFAARTLEVRAQQEQPDRDPLRRVQRAAPQIALLVHPEELHDEPHRRVQQQVQPDDRRRCACGRRIRQ